MHIRWLAALLLTTGVLGGCHRLDALSGQPVLEPRFLVPDAVGKLIRISQGLPESALPKVDLPEPCLKAMHWDETYKYVSNKPSGVLVPGQPEQPLDVYERYRDICIYTYLDAIDIAYLKFKSDLLALVGDANAGADITVLALTGAATGIGSKTTKTILSGIATFIGGVKDKISADVLYNATVITLLQRMDADRNEAKATILQRIQKGFVSTLDPVFDKKQTKKIKSGKIEKRLTVVVPATASAPASTLEVASTRTFDGRTMRGGDKPATPPYTMYEAANDLVLYYAAGTFSHAVVSIQEHTGAAATNCKAAVKNLKTTGSKGGDTDPDAGVTGVPASSTPNAQPHAC